MVGHDERDEQDQQRWHARFAKERLGLSASVDETLADPRLNEEFDDELHDEPESIPQESQALLIPPRLSLQSKQMPAVRIVPDKLVRPMTGQDYVLPETNHVEVLPAIHTTPDTPKKKRLAGRNTKVHLQAVPKTEKRGVKKMASSPGIVESTIVEQALPASAFPETRESEGRNETTASCSAEKRGAAGA